MPPPRLIRPPRPCQPVRSPLQARYASGNANSSPLGGRDDTPRPSPSGTPAAATKHPTSTPIEPTYGTSAPKSSWWGAVFGGVSMLVNGGHTSQATEPFTDNAEKNQPRKTSRLRQRVRLVSSEDSNPSSPNPTVPSSIEAESTPHAQKSQKSSKAKAPVGKVPRKEQQASQVLESQQKSTSTASDVKGHQEHVQSHKLPRERRVPTELTSPAPIRKLTDSWLRVPIVRKIAPRPPIYEKEYGDMAKASEAPITQKYSPLGFKHITGKGTPLTDIQKKEVPIVESGKAGIWPEKERTARKAPASNAPVLAKFEGTVAQNASTLNTPLIREAGRIAAGGVSKILRSQDPGITQQQNQPEPEDKTEQTLTKSDGFLQQQIASKDSSPTSSPNVHKDENDSEIKQMLQCLLLEVQSLKVRLDSAETANNTTSNGKNDKTSESAHTMAHVPLLHANVENLTSRTPTVLTPAHGEKAQEGVSGQREALRASNLEETRGTSSPAEQVIEAVENVEKQVQRAGVKHDSLRLVRALHTKASGMGTPNRSNDIEQSSGSTPDEKMPGAEPVAQDQELMETSATHATGASSTETKRSQDETPSLSSPDMSEQTLLSELFPEINITIDPQASPRHAHKSYPKLDLPSDLPTIERRIKEPSISPRERMIAAFQSRGHEVTILQLSHCSTELTESDFRHVIPKGKHIESWQRSGDYYKIIPGRDPLSLERMPFYYLLFKTPEAALKYQNNASRLHRLSALHQPSSILSPIPPPKGLLEDGEDINFATTSYTLAPRNLFLHLNVVMQPYGPHLLSLVELGGYKPIVPFVDPKTGNPIHRVLMSMAGWEPDPHDLYKTLNVHALSLGFMWPYANGQDSIHRLRSLSPFAKHQSAISTQSFDTSAEGYKDLMSTHRSNVEESETAPEQTLHQIIMTRLYNRWIIDFTEEGAARRFARMWHRKVLPQPRYTTWKDVEEVRMCTTEYLW
ncbi:hypothetical protein P154DRAFT_517356 [Amniculicola lignicola CBS 123094]|uniref:Uncharacterized protein n=1 Tax=Amniculicola lignicola CBS 123094 TaxID=1392246 RepID=A0A6A5X085_9PLEO|nr:hypothetical protein P154DRAFT_517356 [Amniculicola lignicola CBS 123094]